MIVVVRVTIKEAGVTKKEREKGITEKRYLEAAVIWMTVLR